MNSGILLMENKRIKASTDANIIKEHDPCSTTGRSEHRKITLDP